ncbi:MAG: ribose 5-phosphate isomerase A [Planctomycetes bacterium GWF2_42_9]|nr:MAG: ribose 5-phosphate isomerase A [Planctomycetes bacterium GWF2_42_9]
MSSAVKKAAALEAIKYVQNHTIIGLGSGTTAEYFTQALGEKIKEGFDVKAAATSYESQMLAFKYNIPLLNLQNISKINLAVDGADEVDPNGNAIKGKGGAQTMEKIVASMTEKFIIIIDGTKMVNVLGRISPVPVEVIPQALRLVQARLDSLGCEQTIRISAGKVGPVITDLGNIIIDAKFDSITDPYKINHQLNNIPGVVGHGLFVEMADKLIAANLEGTEIKIIARDFN